MSFLAEKLQPLLENPFIVGLAGGVVALKGAPGASWPERLFNIICASLMAGFGGPAVAEWFSFTSPAMLAWSAFLIGLFGLNLAATGVDWIRSAKPGDVIPWWPKKGGD